MDRTKFFILLAAVGLCLTARMPAGWADPGDTCNPAQPLQCNPCNSETCQGVTPNGPFQCADGTGSFTNPPGLTPFCPVAFGDPPFPGCWTTCSVDNVGNPVCAPNDAYCGADICGEVCSDDPADVTDGGCVPIDPTMSVCDDIPGICGNGVCEPGESGSVEDCANCADCLAPAAVCDDTTGNLCPNGDADCEDGDVCTLNTCGGATAPLCLPPEPRGCSGDLADGCCPEGCVPREGSACANQPNCDVDCIPIPSPSPSPPPVVTGCLEGSGKIGSGTGGPGCGGFTCSLKGKAGRSSMAEALGLFVLFAIPLAFAPRKKYARK